MTRNDLLIDLNFVWKVILNVSLLDVLGKWRELHCVRLSNVVAVIWYDLAVSFTVFPCRCLREYC